MHLGDRTCWIDLEIAGFESEAVVTVGDEYDIESDWFVLRAELHNGGSSRTYDGMTIEVEEAARLTRWLLDRANPAGDKSDVGASTKVSFTEPDVAAEVVMRADDGVSIRWYFHDEDSTDLAFQGHMSYRAAAFDVIATWTQLALAARALFARSRVLIDDRASSIRTAGGHPVGTDPFIGIEWR